MEATAYHSELNGLMKFFKRDLPTGKIKINECETIANPMLFVNGHLNYLCSATPTQIERDTFLPYLVRLKEFKKFLQGQN